MEAASSASRGSRRAFIAAGLGGLAATAAHALGRPLPAQAGHQAGDIALHLGQENESPGGAGTEITNGQLMAHGLVGTRENEQGVEGGSTTGPGVRGLSVFGDGVQGMSWEGGGVVGSGGHFEGDPPPPTPPGPGVIGLAPGDAPGVRALSFGAQGETLPDGGLALEVIGKASFSTAGAGIVQQGQNSVFVANAAVTEASHITVTPVGDPGSRTVRWIARDPGGGFTVHLTAAPPSQRPQTPFTYLIVEPVT